MRSLVQISDPAAVATPTHVTHKRTSLCWKRQRFCRQRQTQPMRASSRVIRCQATADMLVEESAIPKLEYTAHFNLPSKSDCNAIGITRFLDGKNYLVSGATGFVGKAFVEKLLRTVPSVGKIYILIRAKNKEEAKERLYTDIIESEVSITLKKIYGESYKAFMERKLVPVIGNLTEDNLGMDDETIDEIASEIDIIVNSAASTTFNERYAVALNINTQGPARLISFGMKCKNLCLFLHISTAYVNGKRQGNIAEKPFYMGQTIAAEKALPGYSLVSNPVLDINSEMELALRISQSCNHDEITRRMKELGEERASLYGWKDCYTLTKAMGEMLIDNGRGDLPVVIIRPSAIESAYKEPYPGWITGNKSLDPVISLYGKGQLPGCSFVFDPQVVMDIIPVDMVVNTTMAAMAKHGQAGRPELNVYHAGSSSVNPLSLGQMFDICYEYFTHYPLKHSRGHETKIHKMEAMSSVEDFSAHISKIIADQDTVSSGKSHSVLDLKQKRKVEHIINLGKIYEPYFFNYGQFDNTNSKILIDEMSLEEKEMFDFDLRRLDWKDYFINRHIPGIRKHVMKGRY